MDSVSRPPLRRKNSTSNAFSSSFSFKNPYEDVLLANGGERKSLEADEYTEIFSGSSSIPVLDFPGIDVQVGPVDSKLDYTSIFSGFRSEDVFVPYDELRNRPTKKTKQRIPAEARSQELGSLHSSRKTKRPSGEASDQSVNEVKKQHNVPFNKIKQKNSEAPVEETHIEQVPAADGVKQQHNVPFNKTMQNISDAPVEETHIAQVPAVGGVKQQLNAPFNKTKQKISEAPVEETHIAQVPVVPEFTCFVDTSPRPDETKGDKLPSLKHEVSRTWSFSVEPVKNGGGSSYELSQMDDQSHNEKEVNLKSQFSEVPSPSMNKDLGTSRVSNSASKDDASRKSDGECSPPLFDEELDENSADAVSAAALKKAIEQAQESIRIAKMIMERKREGYHGAFGSKYNNAKAKHDELDHTLSELSGINRRSTPYIHTDTVVNGANSKVIVQVDKELEEAFEKKSKLFNLNVGQSDRFHNDDCVKVEKLEKKVEAADTHNDGKDYPGLVANVVCETVSSEPEKLRNSNSFTPSIFGSDLGQGETGKGVSEREKVEVHHTEGSEIIPELFEKSVEADELCQTKEHESVAERHLLRLEMTEVMEKNTNSRDREELPSVENLIPRPEFNNVLDKSCKLFELESLDQGTETISEHATDWKENDQHEKCYDEEISGSMAEEARPWFESNEHLSDAPLQINEKELTISPEIREVEKEVVEGHEAEVDEKKQDCTGDADKPKLTDKLMHNKVGMKEDNNNEYEAFGTMMMEADYICSSEEKDNIVEGEDRNDGDNKLEFHESAYEEDVNEAAELSSSDARNISDEADTSGTSTIFDVTDTNDTSTLNMQTQEAFNADSNNKEEHCESVKNYKENDTAPEVNKTISGFDKDEKAELFLHLLDNEVVGANSLHRSASEEIFVENKLQDAFEGLSSYSETETAGLDGDPEEIPPKYEDALNMTSDVHDAAQENDVKIDGENLVEDLASDSRTAKLDFRYEKQVLEQASECDEVSVSTSSSERIDGLSANESEEYVENAPDRTPDKEEVKDECEMISDERECAEEPIKGSSVLHSEPKEIDVLKDTERDEGVTLSMKDKQENTVGTKERVQYSDSNDQQQRIEAIRRGRELKKDRIAVERAIREARERAFAEARERAERAAVERAQAEARQRVMDEAREKVEKANVVKRSVDKASIEAKLRSERAAVERATAEARERALEKAMSQKNSTEAERVSSSSRNNVLKHSFSSSDLESGTNTESIQRRKARLERHQRIMERAAKALAEKNTRDILAQKEQAERNRLAESLDADIKRWASGKEGNLRALLSTLQYILGTDGGWQPISLTEIITTAAVKKAYRKATLCVHPDKLQQRGASVQQKYICEKVFDLLKAAWNRFNSDER